ncbi:hypothetical protein ATZ33_14410 [Enterococcus silesiacus]|uniref:Serine protease n=1 Tax=Enterococcus silesiacus TaxID=332949 RepID=A0A0S3KE43_9ENTE|nr:hypothetical protein [Enterococcus silesiacus]ALS02526.1 hypothetical protein ATZ33_14410 [Enterococcus silesiacus]OJG93560.1 hypothetical protein RV15_GL000162 [Enterococcus silesiacus]
MTAFIGLLSFLGIIIGGVLSLKAVFKKQPKKKALILTGASFIVMIGALALTPASPRVDIAEKSIETNEQGTAIIEGKTNDQSNITLDGEKIETKNGEFSYKVTLKDDQPQKLTFVASIGDTDKAETVEVKPSKAFVAFLNEEKQEQETLEQAETALVLAESKPTQKNYDEAVTRINSLTKERDDFTKRLAIIKENVPIYEAVELAETKQTKEQVDSAAALVAKATLNKDSLLKRLTTVQQKITEKEKTEKQIASAREAVEKAEQEPTDDHYNQAIARIKELPNGNTDLTNRANAVKQTLTAQKEEAKKVAEAQKKAEQEAQKAAIEQQQAQAAAAQTPETPAPDTLGTEEMVLVTRTGEKYHNRKCGNGTYTPATLEEAQARGLTPCSKCY